MRPAATVVFKRIATLISKKSGHPCKRSAMLPTTSICSDVLKGIKIYLSPT